MITLDMLKNKKGGNKRKEEDLVKEMTNKTGGK